MNISRATSLTLLSACVTVALVSMGACSSVPKPAVADGSSRTPANDPARVQAIQQRVAQDRALLTDNNLLRAQVDALQQKLMEMTTIVREALTLPPAPAQRPQVAPAPATSSTVPLSRQSMSLQGLPSTAYSRNSTGMVIRVFHRFARTEFEPNEATAQMLRAGVRGAEHIDVTGHTDSNVVNPSDRVIANLRAEKARIWLINNGAEPQRISTHWFSAGQFLSENVTPEGRSLNRRVEIDVRNPTLSNTETAAPELDGNELAARLSKEHSL